MESVTGSIESQVEGRPSLLIQLLLFNVPTVLLFAACAILAPFIFMVGWFYVGVPILVIFSGCAIVSHSLEVRRRSRAPWEPDEPSFRRLLLHYELLPYLGIQLLLVPFTIFWVYNDRKVRDPAPPLASYLEFYENLTGLYLQYVGGCFLVVAVLVYVNQKRQW